MIPSITAVPSVIPVTSADLSLPAPGGPSTFGRTITPGFAALLSVYPIRMEMTVPHAGRFTYIHPAAEKDAIIKFSTNPERVFVQRVTEGVPDYLIERRSCSPGDGYSLLVFYDTFEMIRVMGESKTAMPRPAEVVAQKMREVWLSGRPVQQAGGSPGIRFLDSSLLSNQDYLMSEQRLAWRGQEEYAEVVINDADSQFQRRAFSSITDFHRRMAQWMGVENKEWYKPIRESKMKGCKACGRDILAAAIVCQHCQTNLLKFYEDMGFAMEDDPALNIVMAEKAARKAREEKVAAIEKAKAAEGKKA